MENVLLFIQYRSFDKPMYSLSFIRSLNRQHINFLLDNILHADLHLRGVVRGIFYYILFYFEALFILIYIVEMYLNDF